MTLIDRPTDASGLEVLSLRVGLRAARALDRFAPSPVRLKWPNDLMLRDGKLGGILVEVRWRERRPEWVALGLGVNLRPPGVPGGAALGAAGGEAGRSSDTRARGEREDAAPDRATVLGELLPALRAACRRAGPLTSDELREFAERDWACGRRVAAPRAGAVVGISAAGELLIDTTGGIVRCATGSLVLDGETP
jgi:BirA family biotin operon repressor/biotin-[acetyl-CoA-carboxylase] ligase